ncbi:MAG TPA: preprotein translocase subunit YajC [Candidatus Deferrimicrobiaceae bacterium]|jgi:preprotein translocase subunit YajC
MMFFTGVAYAMGPSGSGGGAGGGLGSIAQLAPLLLMFVIFYFLLIRPQQKQAKKHQEFLKALKVGDRVITTGGLFGQITGLTEQAITLEIADKIRVKVARNGIAGPAQESAAVEAKASKE